MADQLKLRITRVVHDAGVNGAGKTTQLQIITGSIQPDGGEILKQKANMKIAYLTQEFDVEPTRTVRVRAVPSLASSPVEIARSVRSRLPDSGDLCPKQPIRFD